MTPNESTNEDQERINLMNKLSDYVQQRQEISFWGRWIYLGTLALGVVGTYVAFSRKLSKPLFAGAIAISGLSLWVSQKIFRETKQSNGIIETLSSLIYSMSKKIS